MKALEILAIALAVYVGIVAAFESLIGVLQPQAGATLVITTFDAEGAAHDRVVSRLESDGQLYVAANHWPRAWYRRALANPQVQVKMDGAKGDYRALPVSDEEREWVNGANPLPFFFRILTGFPPRHFLRLEPSETAGGEPAETAGGAPAGAAGAAQ
jgi:hypothetical protein